MENLLLLVYSLLNSPSTSLQGWLQVPQQLHRQSQCLRAVGSGRPCQLHPTHASPFLSLQAGETNVFLGNPTSVSKLYSSAWILQEKGTLKRVKMTVLHVVKTCDLVLSPSSHSNPALVLRCFNPTWGTLNAFYLAVASLTHLWYCTSFKSRFHVQ